MLAAWSQRYPSFTLITQNVDDLHERAGTRHVIRFHGSIWEVSCWNGCAGAPSRWRDETVPYTNIPPQCPHCQGPLRPGVVWFGEAIDPEVIEQCHSVLDCELFATVGTSSIVYPAADLAFEAKRRGAFTVEINLEVTPASHCLDLLLQGPAEVILDEVEGALVGVPFHKREEHDSG